MVGMEKIMHYKYKKGDLVWVKLTQDYFPFIRYVGVAMVVDVCGIPPKPYKIKFNNFSDIEFFENVFFNAIVAYNGFWIYEHHIKCKIEE